MKLDEFKNDFWTNLDEMVADIEEAGYEVAEANNEYLAIVFEDEEEMIVYLGHANRTIWIERIR